MIGRMATAAAASGRTGRDGESARYEETERRDVHACGDDCVPPGETSIAEGEVRGGPRISMVRICLPDLSQTRIRLS